MDWKDVLSKMAAESDLPAGEDTAPAAAPDSDNNKKKDTLHIVMEKKGRNGKTATIIEGFTCDDEELQSIASILKRKLGVGGSARGGEILIQGDLREKVRSFLIAEGYKVKG